MGLLDPLLGGNFLFILNHFSNKQTIKGHFNSKWYIFSILKWSSFVNVNFFLNFILFIDFYLDRV